MNENITHTVITEVTDEQYEMLQNNSVSANLLTKMQTKHQDVYGERDIPKLVHQAVLGVLYDGYANGDENEEDYDFHENLSRDMLESYVPAISNWPLSVKTGVMNFMEIGYEHEGYSFIVMDSNVTKALFSKFPQLREMFRTDPDIVRTWFQ